MVIPSQKKVRPSRMNGQTDFPMSCFYISSSLSRPANRSFSRIRRYSPSASHCAGPCQPVAPCFPLWRAQDHGYRVVPRPMDAKLDALTEITQALHLCTTHGEMAIGVDESWFCSHLRRNSQMVRCMRGKLSKRDPVTVFQIPPDASAPEISHSLAIIR